MYEDSDESEDFGYGRLGGVFGPPRGFNIRHAGRQRQFRRFYSAYPIAAHPEGNKQNLNYGGKIFMPASALEEISHLEVVYPLLFKLQNDESGDIKRTHCGVLEFTAEEGRVYLPQWMMEVLDLEPGNTVEAINVALLHGSMVKLQPQSTDFLDITDPKAVLENALRLFSALTVGDIISFEYNDKIYRIAVLETQPSPSAINVVETDLSVDFAPPIGYVEPTAPSSGAASSQNSRPASSIARAIQSEEDRAKEKHGAAKIQAFSGSGRVLGRKKAKASSLQQQQSINNEDLAQQQDSSSASAKSNQVADVNDPVPLDIPLGTLFFGYPVVPPPGSEKDPDGEAGGGSNSKQSFLGEGRVLSQRRKR
ncbi:ubiquitin fusion degradation protein [Coemansia sp. RSA 1813]|nr:ubiquitin fusion degradation protein [Coemansia sp. RSA 1646]KAJ1771806.1 ubiquitin fusion degradation protein [Coemansia sp. RSA 1843]KAJ2090771.1 ubiquitin fusion degradation protein [Coemansia sp. RSA 986]KAJ2216019.1 ubiquitin fusion degradation protein [Coemansia sp. RSA 487]KAJ2570433.1 ubiquitin fusion degradation protein [Coemansia sp. RSA 1813]